MNGALIIVVAQAHHLGEEIPQEAVLHQVQEINLEVRMMNTNHSIMEEIIHHLIRMISSLKMLERGLVQSQMTKSVD